MGYGLNFLLLIQRTKKSYECVVANKYDYEQVLEAINCEDSDMIEEALECMNTTDVLCEGEDRDTAKGIAQEYADSHIVTVILEVPCR